MTTSPPSSTAASALVMVRQGQTGSQFVLGLIVLGSEVSLGLRSKSSPLAETKACGEASTGRVSVHESAMANRSPKATRYGSIVTLLDPADDGTDAGRCVASERLANAFRRRPFGNREREKDNGGAHVGQERFR